MTQSAERHGPDTARHMKSTRYLAMSLSLAITMVASMALSAEFGDRNRGAIVAARWCANCHVIDDDAGSAPKDSVPTFIALAARPSISDTKLNTTLSAPHGPMPTHALSRQERADVIAYILSFKPS